MSSAIKARGGARGGCSFSRTLRSLDADKSWGPVLFMGVVIALLFAWTGWFCLARVSCYEVSERARLEVDRAAHPVQAAVSGRIISSQLVLDQQVKAGDVVVQLDSDSYRLQLEEERARVAALSPQISAVQQEIKAAEQARATGYEASSAAFEQAQAQYREAEVLARFTEQEADRLKQLREQGLIAERDFMQGMTEAQRRKAAAQSLQLV